mgnify:CR=1 FL=1
MEYLYELLKYLGSVGAIAWSLGWIIRKLIDSFFNKKIEEYKNNLEKENIKLKISYEKLHTERAEVIKVVYQKLTKTIGFIQQYIKPMRLTGEESEEESQIKAIDAYNEFSVYYRENRLFFNEDLALKIDDIQMRLLDILNGFQLIRNIEIQSLGDTSKKWSELFKSLTDTDIPPLKKEIEIEFRKIIGIE